jgi:hypothetical protein
MVRHTGFRIVLGLFLVFPSLFLPVNASCQSRGSALTRLGEGYLDSLASHAAPKTREANLEEREPKVLVIDFFRSSPGNSSRLGTLLADRFSKSLTAYSTGLNILDRRILKNYLTTTHLASRKIGNLFFVFDFIGFRRLPRTPATRKSAYACVL